MGLIFPLFVVLTILCKFGYAAFYLVSHYSRYLGEDTPRYIPDNANQIWVQVWGAGGSSSGGTGENDRGSTGGAGGFAECALDISDHNLIFRIGGGGTNDGSAAFGGGGASVNADDLSIGGGGGYSGIFTVAGDPLIIAGGGGGAGVVQCNDEASPFPGGSGGGSVGVDGTGSTGYGRGGADSTGGAGCDSSSGSSLQGQSGCLSGSSGGGGGYYGGGAGGRHDNPLCGVTSAGGGSAFTGGCVASTGRVLSVSRGETDPPAKELSLYTDDPIGVGGTEVVAGNGLVQFFLTDVNPEEILIGTGRKGSSPVSEVTQIDEADLISPYSVLSHGFNSVYFSDTQARVIYRVKGRTNLMVYAGSAEGEAGITNDGDALLDAKFMRPRGIWWDSLHQDIFVADPVANRVYRLDGEVVTVFAGNGVRGLPASSGKAVDSPLWSPIAGYMHSSGVSYILDYHKCVISKIDESGDISNFAGIAGTCATQPEQSGSDARTMTLNGPFAIAGDYDGNVYFTEFKGNRVRKVNSDGSWRTILGTDGAETPGIMQVATEAKVIAPSGVTLDGAGNVYVSSAKSGTVRYVDQRTGLVFNLIKGLKFPRGINIDTRGNPYLFVPNTGAHQILRYQVHSKGDGSSPIVEGIRNSTSFSSSSLSSSSSRVKV